VDDEPMSIEDYCKMLAPKMHELQVAFNTDYCNGMRSIPEYANMTDEQIFAMTREAFPDGIPIDFGFNAPMNGWKDYTPNKTTPV
jgi:hypothetical protein